MAAAASWQPLPKVEDKDGDNGMGRLMRRMHNNANFASLSMVTLMDDMIYWSANVSPARASQMGGTRMVDAMGTATVSLTAIGVIQR